MVFVSCRCRVAFQASTVGNTWRVGLMRGCTFPAGPPRGKTPSEGIAGKVNAGGHWSSVKAWKYASTTQFPGAQVKPLFAVLLLAVTFWFASTGRFWVTACPKFDPNTPISKLR